MFECAAKAWIDHKATQEVSEVAAAGPLDAISDAADLVLLDFLYMLFGFFEGYSAVIADIFTAAVSFSRSSFPML